MRISPFQGVRPSPEVVGRVAAPPYDVVSTEEARALACDNPLSLLHVTRAEIDFPESQDPYAAAVYERARANFDDLRSAGYLQDVARPCFYIYQQETPEGHIQRGLAGLCHVSEYESGIIRRHEHTRRDKEDDRTRLTLALRAHPGPVFLMFEDHHGLAEQMHEATAKPPLYNFLAHDSVRHTVWELPDTETWRHAFSKVPVAYVADGHHRAASAVRAARQLGADFANKGEMTALDGFLCVLFPSRQLRILPYHRLVRDLGGYTTEAFLKEMAAGGCLQLNSGERTPRNQGEVCVYVGGNWHTWILPALPLPASPSARLDVARLQDTVLGPLLKIKDPRGDPRIEFAGGIRGPDFLQNEVDAGRVAVAFSMYPVSCDELIAIAGAGEVMPPKSTWFEPKLRSGLFIHTLPG